MREGTRNFGPGSRSSQSALHSEIKQIARSEDKVEVETATGVYVFDKIIITCASFEFARFLLLSGAENEVFQKSFTLQAGEPLYRETFAS